ncbi:hypothetical protein CKS_4552 [Pantoea stewartii subsp. stewartii DC283]|uniref:Uncharacterized protein n=2 Tax=Pantoea stewartii TaxID=66269 RepID=H3RKY2_PANSE|nr:hypothetical protein CKS_4552 [Pantoea stewartii subsp. stewartii DC283]
MPHLLVSLSDPQYIAQMEMMVDKLRIPAERWSPDKGRM